MFLDDEAGSLYGNLMATHPRMEDRIATLVRVEDALGLELRKSTGKNGGQVAAAS